MKTERRPYSSSVNVRQSNFELLRIVSMFMVLVLHANFLALGRPDAEMLTQSPNLAFIRYLLEALCIGAVDVFILISGWFGINFSFRGLCKFVFQCLFYSVGIGLVFMIFSKDELSFQLIKQFSKEMLFGGGWFVKSYLVLFILAPVLNAFVEKATKKQFRVFLCCFFAFQTLFGWITRTAEFFLNGYSVVSFIGLYLLARYVRIYGTDLLRKPTLLFVLSFLVFSLFTAVLGYFLAQSGTSLFQNRDFSYLSPLTICASLCLLIVFSKSDFSSRTVNFIAASSFSVYLFHINPHIWKIISDHVAFMAGNYPLVQSFLMIAGYLVMVYIITLLIDQFRIIIWKSIDRKCFRRSI